jgi:hypothetical protein
MQLNHGLHLAYCTNVHRGENWEQTFASLNQHTLAVRDAVAPGRPYAIGLRLGDQASRELIEHARLDAFRRWLDEHQCYVFTINGFPYGKFHGSRVKEQVYRPDWTSPDRLAYTNRLFDILAELLPPGLEGSVSTLPGSFKEFITDPSQIEAIQRNLSSCAEHIDNLSQKRGQPFHLGLEPEPLGLFETTPETVAFFRQMTASRPAEKDRLLRTIGVNYDTCHLAIEFEEPSDAIGRLRAAGLKISKIHLSSALKLAPTREGRDFLRGFADDVYLHQVVVRDAGPELVRYRDLDVALAQAGRVEPAPSAEWRVHFHVPIHAAPVRLADNTVDHLRGVMDLLATNPSLCSHLEMETYTWEVMPPELKKPNVADQIAAEYDWCLRELRARRLA